MKFRKKQQFSFVAEDGEKAHLDLYISVLHPQHFSPRGSPKASNYNFVGMSNVKTVTCRDSSFKFTTAK